LAGAQKAILNTKKELTFEHATTPRIPSSNLLLKVSKGKKQAAQVELEADARFQRLVNGVFWA
jgi:hypothetical protein